MLSKLFFFFEKSHYPLIVFCFASCKVIKIQDLTRRQSEKKKRRNQTIRDSMYFFLIISNVSLKVKKKKKMSMRHGGELFNNVIKFSPARQS
jgi:hypothetical protein